MFNSVAQGERYVYFFNTSSRENLELYFALKNKNNLSINPIVKETLVRSLAEDIGSYDTIFVAESTDKFIHDIASLCSTKVIVVQKQSLVEIKNEVFSQYLTSKEKEDLDKSSR